MNFLGLKFQGRFGEYWDWNIYLLTCGSMIKMKWCFSTSNRKILYLTMPIVCRKKLSQSDHMDCKIITIEGEEKVFLVGSHGGFQCFEIQ
jgi:hypothetical protein